MFLVYTAEMLLHKNLFALFFFYTEALWHKINVDVGMSQRPVSIYI